MSRDRGYYWLRDIREGSRFGRPIVAHCDGTTWTFIGSVFLIDDDEEEEDGERFMDRYEVVGRITEPE